MKHRKVRKGIREIETKTNYSGERSPYWEFLSNHQRFDADGQLQEDAIANPDTLSEDDHIYHQPLNDEGEFKFKAVREIISTLSPQQQRLLNLCGMEGQSIKDAAKELGIKPSTAQVFLQRAREKIIRHYQKRKAQAIADGEL